MLLPTELKKKPKSRRAKGASFRLTEEEPFVTFKAQLLSCIDAQLKPNVIDFDLYDISKTTKQYGSTVTSLCNENNYSYLLDYVRNVKATIQEVFVDVQEKPKKVSCFTYLT